MKSEDTVYSRQQRAAKANDRNALIAFVLGLFFLGFGLLAGVTSTGSGVQLSGLIMLAGLVLVVLGIVFRGRRPRR